jgi:hypothetical protein
MFNIPDLTDCANQRYMAPVAGAAASLIPGLDTALPLPRYVHWAVAGAATDAYCRGDLTPTIDQQLLMCALGGVLGGYVISYLR